jgi:hypothetical protein
MGDGRSGTPAHSLSALDRAGLINRKSVVGN